MEKGSARRPSVLDKSSQDHRQSDEHRNCFKGNVGERSERQGGAHMGFSERIDTILNWTVHCAETQSAITQSSRFASLLAALSAHC